MRMRVNRKRVMQCRFFALLPALTVATLEASPTFVKDNGSLPQGAWHSDAADLCFVAQETEKYLEKGQAYDADAIHGGRSPAPNFPLERIIETLQFVCQIHLEDKQSGVESRLQDPRFIEQAFEKIRWYPDAAHAHALAKDKPLLANLPAEQILQTRYFVKIAAANPTKTPATPFGLYGLPFDEQGMSLEEAAQQKNKLTRFRFGKQAILAGALDSPTPLAPVHFYLSREDLEGALLQGTAVVPTQEQYRFFNVHRGNDIPYNRQIKPEQQQRYWYFKEVSHVLGYGKDADYKIPILPKVTVAGDITQLGLGKLVLLRTNETGKPHYQLTILADTGGAFADNLYQLDWLSGYYRGWSDYYQANKHRSDYSDAWLLVKKRAPVMEN